MASFTDPLAYPVVVPADPKFFWASLVAAILAFILGILFSGVRRRPSINPWIWFRAAVSDASRRGGNHFWLVWTMFSFAIIFAFAAIIVGGVLLFRL